MILFAGNTGRVGVPQICAHRTATGAPGGGPGGARQQRKAEPAAVRRAPGGVGGGAQAEWGSTTLGHGRWLARWQRKAGGAGQVRLAAQWRGQGSRGGQVVLVAKAAPVKLVPRVVRGRPRR